MKRWIFAYLAAVAAFLAIDFVWLTQIAGPFYFEAIGPLMADPVRLDIAAGFYLFYVIGVVIFAVAPALAKRSAREAALKGALFGVFAYATYDLTNLATLRDWPWQVAAVDIPWGGVVTALSALAGYTAARRVDG